MPCHSGGPADCGFVSSLCPSFSFSLPLCLETRSGPFGELLSTRAFWRLANVRFIGGPSQLPSPTCLSQPERPVNSGSYLHGVCCSNLLVFKRFVHARNKLVQSEGRRWMKRRRVEESIHQTIHIYCQLVRHSQRSLMGKIWMEESKCEEVLLLSWKRIQDDPRSSEFISKIS